MSADGLHSSGRNPSSARSSIPWDRGFKTGVLVSFQARFGGSDWKFQLDGRMIAPVFERCVKRDDARTTTII